MPTAAPAPLIAQLDDAIEAGSPARRIQILRQVTDLFRSGADRLDESQTSVFDDVLVRLIARADAQTLAHLSAVLSEIELAPRETVRQLALHDDAPVAAPVLTKSKRLSEEHLIEVANTKSRRHLLAISARTSLNETLTDALIKRGDAAVFNALAQNAGARFSESGYAALVGNAQRDETLMERLGVRLDIPAKLLRELLDMATDAVRARFLTATRPAMQKKTPTPVAASAVPPERIDYTLAISEIVILNRAGKLSDSVVNRFAVKEKYTNVVAALAFMSEVEIDVIEVAATRCSRRPRQASACSVSVGLCPPVVGNVEAPIDAEVRAPRARSRSGRRPRSRGRRPCACRRSGGGPRRRSPPVTRSRSRPPPRATPPASPRRNAAAAPLVLAAGGG